jgi:thiol:disulfide interchange protein DsbD
MADGWHTYWKNPGDSGLPTRLRWTLPTGFTAGPLQWPLPQRLAQGPLMSYGYAGEVLLLTRVTPPADLAAGSTHRLAARADWLECKELCLPGRADLDLVLPTGRADPDPAVAPLFARSRAQLPQPAEGWSVRLASQGDRLVLSWPAPPGPDGSRGYFFPETRQVVGYGEPQTLSREGKERRLRLARDPNAVPVDRLTGVLVVGEGADARAYALDIDTKP